MSFPFDSKEETEYVHMCGLVFPLWERAKATKTTSRPDRLDKTVHLGLKQVVYEKLLACAERNGQTLQGLIRTILGDYLDAQAEETERDV